MPSAISSGDTTEFQTFDVAVHTNEIRLVPKFTRMDESVSIKEVWCWTAGRCGCNDATNCRECQRGWTIETRSDAGPGI